MRLYAVAVCFVVAAAATSACVQQAPPGTGSSRDAVSPARQHVPGEVIVQFHAGTSSVRIHEIVAAAGASVVRDLGTPFTCLVRFSSERPMDEIIVRLRGYSEVLNAEPNWLVRIEPPRPIPGFKPEPSGK